MSNDPEKPPQKADFGFDFADYDPKGHTAEIAIPKIGITLTCLPASQDNAGWWAQAQRDFVTRSAANEREGLTEEQAKEPEVLERRRAQLVNMKRRRIPRHLVVGWKGVQARGQVLDYSAAAAVELFAKLPSWAVELVEERCQDLTLFFPATVREQDAKAVAGN